MDFTARFDGVAVRGALLKHGGPDEAGFIRYAYRPFDTRWLYWEMDGGLLDRPQPDYKPHVFDGNLWLVLQNKARPHLSPPSLISDIGDLNPNPPKDTDGRREESGRGGVRELQGK